MGDEDAGTGIAPGHALRRQAGEALHKGGHDRSTEDLLRRLLRARLTSGTLTASVDAQPFEHSLDAESARV